MLMQYKTSIFEKIQLGISIVLQVSLVVAAGVSLFESNWTSAFVSTLALLATFFPAVLNKSIRVHLPPEFTLILTIFVYAAIFLGEVYGFYTKFWWWDLVLHGVSGLTMGFIGFLILFTLYSDRRLNLTPFLLAIFSFAFALAVGALWEIFEFTMDTVFGFSMQKNGLEDTMWDLIVDSNGALFAAIFGYLYVKKPRRGLFNYFVGEFFAKNPHLKQ